MRFANAYRVACRFELNFLGASSERAQNGGARLLQIPLSDDHDSA